MKVLEVRNVNEAYRKGAALLRETGVALPSRAGSVIVAPTPVTTVYSHPLERVLFDERRDANPFFHFFESLWMLSGRNDIAFPSQFNHRFLEFSDDGKTQHAAYGYRWRQHFNNDQLPILIEQLKTEPGSRRAFLTMWDPDADLGRAGKDFPCNVGAVFDVRNDRLHMYVFNRSNDIVWGAYGANAVHMSYLLEYMAGMIGIPAGTYTQVSVNYHVYTEIFLKHRLDQVEVSEVVGDPYAMRFVTPYERGLVTDPKFFDNEVAAFVESPLHTPHRSRNLFFAEVAIPLMLSWQAYKVRDFAEAHKNAKLCQATDWSVAAQQWLKRRKGGAVYADV